MTPNNKQTETKLWIRTKSGIPLIFIKGHKEFYIGDAPKPTEFERVEFDGDMAKIELSHQPQQTECKCACHENKLKKPYAHDTKCCDNMNGFISPQQTEDWEKELGELFDYEIENALLEYARSEGYIKPKEFPNNVKKLFKDFIRNLLSSYRTKLKGKIEGLKNSKIPRSMVGKYKGSRRTKNTKSNPRGKWQFQKDRPSCVHCGLKARYHTKNPDGSVKYWRNLCTMCYNRNK